MYISRLLVRNFRNLRSCDVPVSKGVTCFVGENNSGKSNLIEAVRLVLDGTMSAARRRLRPEDLSDGLSFSTIEQVLISVEFTDFAGKPSEEALFLDALVGPNRARVTYRFRPVQRVREEFANGINTSLPLTMEDYRWELVGGDTPGQPIDLTTVQWDQDFGKYFRTDVLQQGFLVVLLNALRDVEASLSQSRTSPLQQIVEQRKISDSEQVALVQALSVANTQINDSATITAIGSQLTRSFEEAVGPIFTMEVELGLSEPTFAEITRALRVLLSGYGMSSIAPARNGLGLNNILYITLYLSYFAQRLAEAKTAGQLLLVEEPEAHLHPQLQRVLLATLQSKGVQAFITTHSTHITSGVPLASQVILTSNGTSITTCVSPASIPQLSPTLQADLERYLDATRSTLLFARGVLLVEGPAEQFLIPPLAKTAMGLDLDQLGIAVIPIFGKHFTAYARLFGPAGFQKKCAIVTDGDVSPVEDDDTASPELVGVVPILPDLAALRNSFVEVFQCAWTFEPELAIPGNLEMLARAAGELGATVVAGRLRGAIGATASEATALGPLVLSTAKRFGKARFAQVASRHMTASAQMPDYISNAIAWLV